MNSSNFVCNNIKRYNDLSKLTRENKSLNAFCLNVQRACDLAKFQRIANYIDQFRDKPKILGIVETWFNPAETGEESPLKNPIRLYELDGYSGTFCSRYPSPN